MEKNKIEKVYDQIHAPESLKQETFEKMKSMSPKKNYNFILSIAALFVIAFAVGITYYANKPSFNVEELKEEQIAFETETADLLHFNSVEELREYFNKNYNENEAVYYDSEISIDTTMSENAEDQEVATKAARTEDAVSDLTNYYQTNTQVENVDEADIVKTDGEYIYYITNDTVYIIKADDLNIKSKITFGLSENSRYYPSELFISGNKLIIIGNYFKYSYESDNEPLIERIPSISNINTTKAYVYDISDKTNPNELRQVDIDGTYDTARLINDTIYLMSTKYIYYYSSLDNSEILPIYYDSVSSTEYRNIDCKDIIYNDSSNDSVYKTIGAFNINKDDEVIIETFLGYGETVYCSENNLYLTTSITNEGNTNILYSTEIYKFNISSGGLKYACKSTIDGNVNNQFSLDEYNGNLRIATTVTIQEEPNTESIEDEYTVVTIGNTTTNNILYVLDENLEKIGELTDFGIEEEIYSVRFINNIAYIVTFEEVDPLFVIDLSDPTNPIMKGELEIPGYSSYLHPYDENHIIGIGYNVKDNGYGGVTNETIKISMFDVSDLSNPKEIFSKTLGDSYSYSDVINDHKLLMYDKERNLMGFPITIKNNNGKYEKSILILNIDLENEEFTIHSQYTSDSFDYNIRKVIYIGDTVYILCYNKILAFDINTLENIGTLQLPSESNYTKSTIVSDVVLESE